MDFLPVPLLLLSSSLLKNPIPLCFLLGTKARAPTALLPCLMFWEPVYDSGVCTSVFGASGFCSFPSLSAILSFGDLGSILGEKTLSSANIRSRREDRVFKFLPVLGLEKTLSRNAASLGEDRALSCLPRFRMVSWHSANLTVAAVISHPCQFTEKQNAVFNSSKRVVDRYKKISNTRFDHNSSC